MHVLMHHDILQLIQHQYDVFITS
eukprot:UN10230